MITYLGIGSRRWGQGVALRPFFLPYSPSVIEKGDSPKFAIRVFSRVVKAET
jgi:hypothetical protein